MAIRSSVFSLLLLTADSDLHAQLKQDLKEATITVAKDLASVPRAAVKRGFDGVLFETKRGSLQELNELQRTIDPAHTFILAGSRTTLRRASVVLQALANGHGRFAHSANGAFSLEDYIESKLGDFVKEMKNGSPRNLHPMLIKAVERPLITLVLKETNGNQIQAAHLLGMNRNTLRKKITDLRIPLTRQRARSA
ncbi:MAG: hypothetical protein HY581_09185 [Nitrospirae bacterium]|nr:hypothetical protein [Nitrospirota bacterium]